MEIFIARQPIFTKVESVFGFELLYRNNIDNTFPNIDGDTATLDVLTHSFLTIGINELAGDKLCFINFTENLLEKEVLKKLPPKRIVVEILESIKLTPALLEKIRQIKALGFLIALDDFMFTQNKENYHELFKLVNFIKVDFLSTPIQERRELEYLIKREYPHIILLAEKVETRAQFYEAKTSGYSLFQGYFFAKPEIVKAAEIPHNMMIYVRLISMLRDESVNIDDIVQEIERDLSLTFKVLKMINSPAVRTKSKVRSIKHGVLLLGLEELNHWIHVLLLREARANKENDAIIEASLFRAKFCEQLAKRNRCSNPSEYFLLGMFSLIDTLLQRNIHQLLKELPLSDEVTATLSGVPTEMTDYLNLAIAYDEVKWEEIGKGVNTLEIDFSTLNRYYIEARKWSADIVAEF